MLELKTLGFPLGCEDGCLDRLGSEDGSGVGPPLTEGLKDGATLGMPDKDGLSDGWALGWDEGIELGQSGIEGFDSSLLNCINGTQLGRPLR